MRFLFLICITVLSACSLSPDIEGIIDKSGKSIATVQLANTGKSLADTRRIKAETTQKFGADVMLLIGKQPIELQADLIKKSIEAKVEVSKNTRSKGWLDLFILGSILALFIWVLRYFFPKPKKETKEF